MSALVFVDANVLLYSHAPAEGDKRDRAAEWLGQLWREQTGRTSMQVLSEYYSNATRKFRVSPEKAWEDVSALFAWQPREIDEELMRRARELEHRFRLSWWDSMVVAAAQLEGCGTLLTEDLQDGQIFGALKVKDPFRHAVREPEAGYRVERAPLHRPRGRPRAQPPAR